MLSNRMFLANNVLFRVVQYGTMSHLWLLKTCNVVLGTKKLNFEFYSILALI